MLLSRVLLAGAATLFSLGVSVEVFPLNLFSDRDVELVQHNNRHLSVKKIRVKVTFEDADHSYFMPAADEVSGFPNNDKPFHRSPCPAINALANHGYIARDGKNLTRDIIKHAVMDVYHIGDSLGDLLVGKLPENLTLADLSLHNLIEHDASMVHDDTYFGNDPAQVNKTLVSQLLARADKDGMLTKKIVAEWRREREEECAKADPDYTFSFHRQASAYPEAAAFLVAMGDYDSESISVADAESFLLHERFPENFERSPIEITVPHTIFVASKIKVLSRLPFAKKS